MPPAVLKNRRRVMPCFFASSAPICFTRASNSFCRAVCGEGMYSSLDAHCTGIGEGKSVSAPSSWASSSGVSMGLLLWLVLLLLLLDSHEGDFVGEAVGEHEVAFARDVGVPHDVAAAGNGPGLEFLGLRIEAHHGVRRGLGLAVPDYVPDRRDAVGRGLRAARRGPFLHLAVTRIELAEVAARVVGVPDHVVGGDGDAPRARCGIRKREFLDLQ